MATGNQSTVTLKDSRVIMPEPVMQKAEWSYGGSGGGYTDNSKYAVFKVGGAFKREADLQPGDVWTQAKVLQKQADGSFTQWTFLTGGGGSSPPQTLDAARARQALEDWLGVAGGPAFDIDVNTLTPPPNPGTPPPPPPASSGITARLTVQPSQFLKLEDRMRVALWLES
jgi:hypothetical protein